MLKHKILLLIYVYGFGFSDGNWIADIRTNLLKNYDPYTRPVNDFHSNTTVRLSLFLNNLDLDDHAQRLSVISFLLVTWKDEFLVWDPASNGGVETLHFDPGEIWRPDVTLYNSATSSSVSLNSDLPILSYSNGSLTWVPPFTASVPCSIDIEQWPSDTHTCVLRIGSWAHHGEHLDLQLTKDDSISVTYYEKNTRWSLTNYSAARKEIRYNGETYIYIDFKVKLKREAAAYAGYVTQTAFAVMLIVLGSYLLPLCYHLSRFLLHLFSISVLLIGNFMLFSTLPATGGSIPHVVKYYSGTIILTTLSLLCNVVMATSLSSQVHFSYDVKKTLASFFKPTSVSTTAGQGESEEIAYATLHEELAEFPPSPRSNVDQNCAQSSEPIEDKPNTVGIHRLLNGVLLAMFSLAFIIDFTVMKNEIA